jgi:hypothetical protein
MRRLVLVLGLCFGGTASLLACDRPAPRPAARREVLHRLAGLADQACACRELACADAATTQMMQLLAMVAGDRTPGIAPDDVAAARSAVGRAARCRQALGASGGH